MKPGGELGRRRGVVVNPEMPRITVYGYTGIDAILEKLPQLEDVGYENAVARALTEARQYVQGIFYEGGVIDTRGEIHPFLPSRYTDELREELKGSGILSARGAFFRDQLKIDLLALNLSGLHSLHLLTPDFARYLKYQPDDRFKPFIHTAPGHPDAPTLPSIITMLGRRVDDMLVKNAPAKAIISPQAVARQATFDLVLRRKEAPAQS